MKKNNFKIFLCLTPLFSVSLIFLANSCDQVDNYHFPKNFIIKSHSENYLRKEAQKIIDHVLGFYLGAGGNVYLKTNKDESFKFELKNDFMNSFFNATGNGPDENKVCNPINYYQIYSGNTTEGGFFGAHTFSEGQCPSSYDSIRQEFGSTKEDEQSYYSEGVFSYLEDALVGLNVDYDDYPMGKGLGGTIYHIAVSNFVMQYYQMGNVPQERLYGDIYEEPYPPFGNPRYHFCISDGGFTWKKYTFVLLD